MTTRPPSAAALRILTATRSRQGAPAPSASQAVIRSCEAGRKWAKAVQSALRKYESAG